MKPGLRLAFLVLVCCVPAEANLIDNGGFELGAFTGGTSAENVSNGSTVIAGWTVVASAGINVGWLANGNIFDISTPFGNMFVDLTGSSDTAPYGGVSQSVATTAGTSYTLTYDLGVDQSSSVFSGPVGITASAGSTSGTCNNYNPAGTGSQWETCTLNFVAPGASTLITLSGQQGDQFIGLDNVDLEVASSAPEPSFALPVLIAISLLAPRKRFSRGA
ncbi:MAG: DUF642 domain-containing protein [Bryobacteraceae bacterium]|jgi:hypothetical protein